MGHVVEPAASGRAKCRGCGRKIAGGELRLGERFPNPFADEGDMTVWFHLTCGAHRRPEPLLEALATTDEHVAGRDELEAEARRSLEHRRLPRIDGVERASSGRARCRDCREAIEKGAWRIRLAYYEDGRFAPGGFVHASCAVRYFGTSALRARLCNVTPDLPAEELAELEAGLSGA